MAKRKFISLDCKAAPTASIAAGTAATGADTTVTRLSVGGTSVLVYNTGTNTGRIVPAPVVDGDCTNGLELPSTATDNVGGELCFGILVDEDAPYAFKVGTHAFKLSLKMGIPVVADYDVLFVGFRKAGAHPAAVDAHAKTITVMTDNAGFNINAGDIFSAFRINSGTGALVDTTLNWANDAVKTLSVEVGLDRLVTLKVDGTAITTGALATPLDVNDIMIPTIVFAKAANGANTPPIIESFSVGLQ
jgi:hypothetical protein